MVSFEEKTPSVDELTSRWRDISKCNLPFLVCELDNAVVGYAYATKFRSRAAYRHTVILHRKLGFREVGTLHDVGYKNHKWIDRLIMEYIIK